MRISDWSSDVCSSDLLGTPVVAGAGYPCTHPDSVTAGSWIVATPALMLYRSEIFTATNRPGDLLDRGQNNLRSEEHTSELHSLMRISYAVFCLKKKTKTFTTLINTLLSENHT